MDALLSDADLGLAPASDAAVPTSAPAPQTAADPDTSASAPLLPGEHVMTVQAHPPAQSNLLSDDDLGIAPPLSATSTLSDVGESALSGVARGIVSAPFAPAAIAKAGADAIVGGGDWLVRHALGLAPPSQDTLAKQAAARAAADNVGGIPSADTLSGNIQNSLTPYLHTPQTGAGQFAQTVGEFAPFAASSPAAISSVGNATKALAVGALAPAAGSAGLGAATQGTSIEPYARAAGALIGGVGAAGTAGMVGKAGQIAEPAIAKMAAVMGRPAMQEGMAARAIVGGASDPAAMRNYLTAPQPAPDVVPEFKPTLYQDTGDQGIGQMERVDKTANNNAPYLDRAAEQNQANSAAVRGLAPSGADVMAPVAHVQNQLDRLDQITQSHMDAIKTDGLQRAAQIGPGAGPEVVGSDIRSQLSSANEASRAAESKLWNAVDPDGTLTNSTAPIAKANQDIYGNLSKADREFLSPAETKLSGIASGYGPVEPFHEVAALRSNLASEMRNELAANGKTPAYRRMSMLMGGVQRTINEAVEGRAAQEVHAVSQGAMTPADTMISRLQREADEFSAARRSRSGTSASSGDGENGAVRASSVSPALGAQGQSGVRSGIPSGDQGVQSQATFDQAAADRVKAASAATRENRQTFGKGPVGETLRTAGTADSFRLPDSAVPAKVFPAGAKGYEAVQSYLKAAGSGPEQLEPLKNAALESLRSKIADGQLLTQKTLDDWRSPAKYGNALRAIDEVSPGFSKQFDSAAKVSDVLDQAVAARKATMKAYQSGLVGKMIGAKSEDEVVNHFKAMLGAPDRVTQMQTVLRAAKGNPDAVAGIKKAVGDALAKRFMTQTEAGTSGEKMMSANSFKKIYADAAPVLSQVYSPEEMDTMRKVANGFDLAARSVNNKVAGSPGTAADLLKSGVHKAGEAGAMLAVIEGLRAGYEHGGVHGAMSVGAVAGGAYMLRAIRNAGIHDVQHLISDALQNPDRARLYARNLKGEKDAVSTADLLRRSFLATPLVVSNPPNQSAPHRAKGGRVEEPSEAQKEAGNYKKDHVRFAGLDIAIENKKGGERSGVGKDGKRWSVKMPADYGYIKRTVGADGDHVDCYLGPDENAGTVFVVDQKDLASGRFDEHKCMIGFKNRESALGAYQKGFSDGKGAARIMKVTPMPLGDFKTWLRDEDTRKPILARASGGRIPAKERVPLAGARKANDGKWYVPDIRRPGKYSRIDFR